MESEGSQNLIPETNSENSRGNISRLRRFGHHIRSRIPWMRNRNSEVTTLVPNPPEQTTLSIVETEGNENLQQRIEHALAKKGLVSPEFNAEGVSEFSNTNESFDPTEFRSIGQSEQSANGYIVGVGTKSIFSALELFKREDPPKGIVLINIDGSCIQDALGFIEGLKNGKLVSQTNSREKETDIASILIDSSAVYEDYQQRTGLLPPVTQSVWKNAQLLSQLAKEGKIAAIQQDIFNPRVLETVKENLPGIENSRNAIYLSNVGDWIRRKWTKDDPAELEYIQSLEPDSQERAMERRSHSLRLSYGVYNNLGSLIDLNSDRNYFIDSSERNIDGNIPYKQRVRTGRPNFWSYNDSRQLKQPTFSLRASLFQNAQIRFFLKWKI